jgi:hypothetical protein
MKKCPRWAAAIVVLTVILSTVLAPLEGVAAPGPIKLPNEPRYLMGDPDAPPYSIYPAGQFLPIEFSLRFVFFVRQHLSPLPSPAQPGLLEQ